MNSLIVGERASARYAVVARLMMLEAEVRDLIAERHEEVIRPIVPALVERAGLPHQPVELGDVFLRQLDLLRPVGGHVEIVLRRNLRARADLAEVPPGEHRRIDQLLEAYRLEGRRLARAAILVERRAELPARRQQ